MQLKDTLYTIQGNSIGMGGQDVLKKILEIDHE